MGIDRVLAISGVSRRSWNAEAASFSIFRVRFVAGLRSLGEINLCHSIAMSFEPTSNSGHEPFVLALTRHERVIRAYVRGAGISRPADVDEIIQEVSLIAWQKFEQLEDIEEFPRWACVIARYRRTSAY